ncbi:MAG: 16S rRNA (uracil(1498)-N(3))-methyltransferase [Burkholderiales bacterium]|nr:MAG: 16S rRNA (uracil(1498)-N(3))-methyltransferase [Betaproteobacteria bacterium]TAG84192.1 MAG: 16S rRNA (uracil(1498)-N(3))-methyltransferase [Burkholderiales bacterium]
MPRFFSETPIVEGARVVLDTRIAQHVRVLRLREADLIALFDGAGGEVPATIVEIGKRDIIAETAHRVLIERELARKLTLSVGLIANDRFDWLIQKATELGVAAIQPLYTERSQRIPGDIEKRVAHWRGVVIAACEQCGRNQLPLVSAPISLAHAIESQSAIPRVLMDAEGEPSIAFAAPELPSVVFVGPEGGFSPNELALLRERCEYRLRVGQTVLRAETAAIAAVVRLAT